MSSLPAQPHRKRVSRLPLLPLVLQLVLVSPTRGATSAAQSGHEDVPSIQNFGRVTATLYRGGDFMPHAVAELVARGVRTVISLQIKDRRHEPETCRSHGITYYRFPMDVRARPDSAMIDSILDIIRSATAPVYLHCTAGSHRTGTVCALYRIRVQGWSPQRAWAEEESYGFGLPGDHSELFRFVYGEGALQSTTTEK